MKTLKESLLDPGFDVKEDKEIFMALNSVEWEHYVRHIFRTEELSIYDILEKYLTKFIDKKISITQAHAACTNPEAIKDLVGGRCVLVFGRDRWSSRGQTKEEWDYIQIITPEQCVRIRKYTSSCDPLRVEIIMPTQQALHTALKKTTIKKAFVISNGESLTKAFWDFYEHTIRRKDIVALPY